MQLDSIFILYQYTSIKINRVSGAKAFFNFIKNLALLSLLSSRTKNSFNTKIIILSVNIPIKPNTSFLVVIRKQGLLFISLLVIHTAIAIV